MLNIDLSHIISEELLGTIQRIAANVWRNKQNATGQAINSLNEKHTPNSGAIWAVDYFKNLEIGTLPGTYVTPSTLNAWGKVKGYWSQDNSIPFLISRKIYAEGSLLFRKGGRTDVYTNEIPSLIERIADRAGEEIVNIKLID